MPVPAAASNPADKTAPLMPQPASPDRYAVIGQPVAHSASPAIHRLFAQQFNEPMEYGRIEASPVEFPDTVAAFFAGGGKGLNVTAPHKMAAHDLADSVSMHARVAGSVNTLAMRDDGVLAGDNTDGTGLIRDLTRNLDLEIRDKRLLMVGAGGAARGVLAALLGQSPRVVVIANRSVDKAAALVQGFEALGPLEAVGLEEVAGQRFDLVINATSASLAGAALALPGSAVDGAVAYDMAYSASPGPFLRWADAHGAIAAHQGWGMLVEQAAESYYLWRGVRPYTSPILRLAGELAPNLD